VFTTFDFPGEAITNVSGINNVGQIVGTAYDPNHGFTYSNGMFTSINFATGSPFTITEALGINDVSQVVGDHTDNTRKHGFLYTNSA
jgi:probable HAF family extracellular repeat protein